MSDPSVLQRLMETAALQLREIADQVPDAATSGRMELLSDLVLGGAILAAEGSQESAALASTVRKLIPSIGDPSSDEELHRAGTRLLARPAVAGLRDQAPPHGRTDELTAEQVQGYLRHRFPDAQDEVVSVTTIHGGYSKRTTLVDGSVDGVHQEFVLRQAPVGLSARSLEPEFRLLQSLATTDVPSPRPLWIDARDNALGGPFFATRRAAGFNIGDVWGSAGATAETCRDVAEIYAHLHQVPTESLVTPVSPRVTPGELVTTIAKQESTLHQRGIPVQPVLAALLEWLRRNLPDAPPRPSLLHGDAAFSNLLVADGRVTAVVDWEAAHVGNPAEELAYLRPSVTPVMEWDAFIAEYVRHGGPDPDPSAMQFFTVWSHVWRHIGCLWLAQNFQQTGRYASAIAGFVHGPRFLRSAVDAAFGSPAAVS
jgi:aminoglycoside phosphotransferase (APT) family kinase protein